MADQDWDTFTRIGSKARGPGAGGVDRERVVKGKSALNAAHRSGAITATEKKFTGANTKGGADGQLAAKVDRDPDITVPKKVSSKVGPAMSQRRSTMNPVMSQEALAKAVNTNIKQIQALEKGTGPPDQALLTKIEKKLGIKLRGDEDLIGQPLGFSKKK